MFGCSPPQNLLSQLEKGDHLEMDTSEQLDQEGIEQYQSLIGSLQWAVSLDRMDIAMAVMTISVNWTLGTHQTHHRLCVQDAPCGDTRAYGGAGPLII
jgi:hypothetical protein